MMEQISYYIFLITGILLVGFLGEALSKKIRVPYYLWLLILGIIIGEINILPRSQYQNYNLFIAEIVATLVFYNAGLKINIKKDFKDGKAILISILEYAITSFLLFSIFYLVRLGIYNSLALALVLSSGGINGAELLYNELINNKSKIKNSLMTKEIIAESISIILVIGILEAKVQNFNSIYLATETTISAFSIAILISLIAGILWIKLNSLLRKKGLRFTYALSLAVVFLIYEFTDYIGGAGPIAVFSFGIVESNAEEIYEAIGLRSQNPELGKMYKEINDLLTFFAVSFFFVYAGSIFIFNIEEFLIALIASIEIIILSLIVGNLYKGRDVGYYSARGLVPAILSAILSIYFSTSIFIFITFVAIIITNISTSLLSGKIDKLAR
ncbi:MAG: cation:proton antiporter [Candidatus Rehaiarchaeum fermentans]|nr:cation:proton antiporter [Candidatus Rehaiarchaeum fermentans]